MVETRSRKFLAEKIRVEYLDDDESMLNPFDNLTKLRIIDRKTKRFPRIFVICLGLVFLILFGFGIALASNILYINLEDILNTFRNKSFKANC